MNRSNVRTTGLRHATTAVVVALALGTGGVVGAQDASRPGRVAPLMTKDLSGIAGKDAVMMTVSIRRAARHLRIYTTRTCSSTCWRARSVARDAEARRDVLLAQR
jgi:hypothetical protein